jgi:hypothetical protein
MSRVAPIDINRALFRVSWRTRVTRVADTDDPGVISRDGGIAVTVASRHLPYALAGHANGAGVRHHVRVVLIAWRRARPVGALVVAWCGSKILTGRLVDGDAAYLRDCPTCLVRLGLPAVAVHVHVHLAP